MLASVRCWFVTLTARALWTAPREAGAQFVADARVAVGTPLRLILRTGQTEEARLVRVSDSGLDVRYECETACDRVFPVAWSDLTRVDARLPQRPSTAHVLRSGARGFLGGAAAGLLLSYVAIKATCTPQEELCPLVGTIIFPTATAVGTLTGFAMGMRKRIGGVVHGVA